MLGWIVVNILIIAGVVVLFKWLVLPSKREREQTAKEQENLDTLFHSKLKLEHWPIEGRDGMTQEDWIKLVRSTVRKESTSTLRIWRNQYADLARRIEERDGQTVQTLGSHELDLEFDLARAQHQIILDEFRRRNVNPFQ